MMKIKKIIAYTSVIDAEDEDDIKLAYKRMCAIRRAIRKEKKTGAFKNFFEINEQDEKLFRDYILTNTEL